MSREIKFRAKCARTGEWKYGFLSNHSTLTINSVRLKIDQETIGQYTGLKDKNGKEIYEGDILSDRWLVEVYKCKKTGAFMVRFHNNPKTNKSTTLYQYLKSRKLAGTSDRDNVVIGNVYQNKDLLE